LILPQREIERGEMPMTGKNREIEIPTMEQIIEAREKIKIRRRLKRAVFGTFALLIVVAAAVMLTATLWIPIFRINGASMAPTLADGDIVIAVKTDNISKDDIVAYYSGSQLFVKRVKCVGGDMLDADTDGNVYVNGVKAENTPLNVIENIGLDLPCRVPEGKCLLSGDNRDEAGKTYSDEAAFVSEEQLAGKIVFRVWPENRIGAVK